MRKTNRLLQRGGVFLLAMTLCWLAPTPSIAQERRPAAGSEKEDGLAISLRGLKSQLASSDARRMFGASRLLGFLFAEDETGKDCILICAQEQNRPTLRLDDLAVAYKNVTAGDARPACTIDPRSEVLAKMATIGRRFMSARDAASLERDLKEWRKWAGSNQDVRVFHIDPGTDFARTCVTADYDLKSICNGAVAVKGITSLSDLFLKQVKDEIAANSGALETPLQIYNRFWFNSGETSYQTDGARLFLLTSCQVVLLTEQEALTENGKRSGTAEANPLAKKFADQLTSKFADLAKAKPVYRELENLYRAVAVADLLQREGEQAGVLHVLDASLNGVEVAVQKPTTELPGKYEVKKAEGQIPGGTYTLSLPSCGGVSIDIDMAKAKREKDSTGRLSKLSGVILKRRPTASSVAWRFPL